MNHVIHSLTSTTISQIISFNTNDYHSVTPTFLSKTRGMARSRLHKRIEASTAFSGFWYGKRGHKMKESLNLTAMFLKPCSNCLKISLLISSAQKSLNHSTAQKRNCFMGRVRMKEAQRFSLNDLLPCSACVLRVLKDLLFGPNISGIMPKTSVALYQEWICPIISNAISLNIQLK